jgi:hypothetical protein
VYRTRDYGTTWSALTGGITLPDVLKLRFDADGYTLYGSTYSTGVVARTRSAKPGGSATLSGSARVGKHLTATLIIDGSPAPKQTISWQRCNAHGGACVTIAHARRTTYTLKAADRGHRIRIVVKLKNSLGKATIRSRLTGKVK